MKDIPDGSVDMILCDLPYGVTAKNKWDTVIPYEPLWNEYKRIIKENGAIVLFGQDKFTARTMLSNEKMHRYNLIWDKTQVTGFLNSKRMPLRKHEDIIVFYKKLPTYNPQFSKGDPYSIKRKHGTTNYGDQKENETHNEGVRYPTSIIDIPQIRVKDGHPTQKPVALMEYLIKMYTNEGDTVLDNASGSGTVAVASVNTNRNWICIEKEEKYVDMSNNRISKHLAENNALQT